MTPPARGADARSANLHVTIYYPDLEIAISIGAHHVSPAAAPPLLGRPSQASQQRGQALSRLQILEVGHSGLTELLVVQTMSERKTAMSERADAVVALPGGWGTLEELFEVVTWTQLEIFGKPAGLLDVKGYFKHLDAFLDHASSEGFIRPSHRSLLQTSSDPEALLELLGGVG